MAALSASVRDMIRLLSPRTMAWTLWPSPTSCAPRRRHRAGPCQPTYWREKRYLTKLAALFAIRLPSPRHARGENQRRSAHCPGRARQQDHPSLQRFPVARYRHRRWHTRFTLARICDHRQSDPDCPFVGASYSQSADARWLVVDQAGCHPASCRAGNRRDVDYNGLSEGEKNQLLAFLDSL